MINGFKNVGITETVEKAREGLDLDEDSAAHPPPEMDEDNQWFIRS